MRYDIRESNKNTPTPRRSLFDIFFGDRFYDEFFNLDTPTSWYPKVNIVEKKDKYILTMEIPGVKESDINIEVKDGILTISGERKEEKYDENDIIHKKELFYGSFVRTFTINDINEDKISAEYTDGLLKIYLPKKEEKQAKKISIKKK